ncbi:11084_t:CDS:2 [Paraglomus brasilianum]|uniref:11084_t:CDS:1 n=1 Tax=Paraglomus brasilianum TaxID=144538 RepID=A0A9N9CF67_9GLOM|nr:11084_t:CDS:2 [Paraglomus brasilianum]
MIVEVPTENDQNDVFIFIDNSNFFNQAKPAISELEGSKWLFKDSRHLLIDYSSCPPSPNDSLWEQIREEGFKVVLYNQNVDNHKMKVDMTLALHMCEAIFTKRPAILALIACDGNYYPQVEKALEKNWTVEIWFWEQGIKRRLQQKYPSHLTKKLVPSNQYPCMSFVVPKSFSDRNFPYFQEMFKDLKEQLWTIFKPLSRVLHVSRDQIILVKHCQPLCLQMARGGAT